MGQRIHYFLIDIIGLLLGQQNEIFLPSEEDRGFVGDGDFKKIGEEFLRYFIELGGLKPNEKVLDIGCGIGRMAIPLTKYLNRNGGYEGFDIIEGGGINWCRKKISRQYPNFHFKLADVYNTNYNPKGKLKACDYQFPYRDESFDFVFLASVFTHMLPKDMENYFSEIARTLKENGRCLISFFLFNKESSQLFSVVKSTLYFEYNDEGFYTANRNNPEFAVAYDEEFIRKLYKKYRLNIIEPIHYGSWCGRKNFLSFQDIIMAVKK